MPYSRKFILWVFVLLCCSELGNIVRGDHYYHYHYGPSSPSSHATTKITTTIYGVSSPLISELRHKIADLGLDYYFTRNKQLARYIENRWMPHIDPRSKYNVNRAAKLLTSTAKWRQKYGADTISHSPPLALLKEKFPYECTGYTDEGNPVFYIPIGKWDYPAVRKAGLGKEIFNYYIRMLEEIRDSTWGRVNPKTGESIDQAVVIENLKGFSIKNVLSIKNNQLIITLRYLLALDRHYPFLFKKYIALGSGLFSQSVWPVVRKFTPRLRNVFHIYTRFSTTGPNELIHSVPKHAIPIELGGTYVSRVSHLY